MILLCLFHHNNNHRYTVDVEPRAMGPEISEMLEKIVHQLDVVTRTVSFLEERLSMVEDKIDTQN